MPIKVEELSKSLNKLFFACLILIIVVLPLPFGSNRLWVLNLIEMSIYSLTAGVLLLWAFGGMVHSRVGNGRIYFFLLLWALWLFWIWLQSSYLPADTVSLISPQRGEHFSALSQAGVKIQSAAISVAPGETREHFWESLAYCGLFFTVFILVRESRDRQKVLLWTFLVSGLFQAFYGSLMVLSGLEYGPWGRKEYYLGSATGTFVNRNHFAGYLQIAISAAIGLHLSIHNPAYQGHNQNIFYRFMQRWNTKVLVIRFSVLFMFIGIILSQSRMGNIAILTGLAVSGLIYVIARRMKGTMGVVVLLLSILILDIGLMGGWFGLDKLVSRYESVELENSHRVNMWPDLIRMSNDYSTVGSGLGTFRFAYPEYRSEVVKGENRHAHNDYLQFLIEVGVIGIAVLLLIVAMALIQAVGVMRKRKSFTYSGVCFAAISATACIATHSLTDFNLQIPANAASLIVLLAMAASIDKQKKQGIPASKAVN